MWYQKLIITLCIIFSSFIYSNCLYAQSDLELVFVKGGTFTMGQYDRYESDRQDEVPAHKVTVDDFYIGKYEVTISQFITFLNDIGCNRDGSYDDSEYGHVYYIKTYSNKLISNTDGNFVVIKPGYNKIPMTNVSWYGTKAYCRWAGMRLPSEAEWEYFAGYGRSYGSRTTASYFINTTDWTSENSKGKLRSVGLLNDRHGVYDFLGNAMEWCNDWYNPKYYEYCPLNNPQGPSTGKERVYRGGSYDSKFRGITPRHSAAPDNMYFSLGFRVASSVEK